MKKPLVIIFSVVGLVVLILAAFFLYNGIERQDNERIQKVFEDAESSNKLMVKNSINDYVHATKSAFHTGAFGGIKDLSIDLENESDYLLEKVIVEIVYIKANGGVWKSVPIDFDMVEPHSTYTAKITDTDRGTNVNLILKGVHSTALEL